MIYSPEIANPTSAVASAQASAQVVKSCGFREIKQASREIQAKSIVMFSTKLREHKKPTAFVRQPVPCYLGQMV